MQIRTASDARVLQVLIAALGIINLATGATLLLAPVWFYATVASYAPYNRHFMGDAGSFVLALGLGLLLAARNLHQQRLLVAMAAVASGLHTANHVLDDILSPQAQPALLATNTLPLLVMTLLLVYVSVRLRRSSLATAGQP